MKNCGLWSEMQHYTNISQRPLYGSLGVRICWVWFSVHMFRQESYNLMGAPYVQTALLPSVLSF